MPEWLVAVQAVHALLRVHAHLVFVDDRILRSYMTFGALSRGSHQGGGRLLRFYFRPRAIQQERAHNQSESNEQGNKDRAKRHGSPPLEDAHRLGF
jgi:hypothetical protein